MEDSSQRALEKESVTQKDSNKNAPAKSDLILKISIGLGVLLTALDLTSVGVSIYPIQESLHVTASAVQWVLLSYLLVVIVAYNISKRFDKLFSYKQIFQYSTIIFILGSLIASITTIYSLVILGRVVQAIGASGILANTKPLLIKYSSSSSQKSIRNLENTLFLAGFIIGPLFGSILTFFIGWQSIFLINVPLGIIGFFLVAYTIPNSKPKRSSIKLDYYNIGILTTSLFFIMYGISIIDKNNLSEALMAFIFMAVGMYLLIVFYANTKKSSDPLINFKFFTDTKMVVPTISTIIIYAILIIILYQLPIFLQVVNNLTVISAGLVIVSSTVSWIIATLYAGHLVDKYDSKIILPLTFLGLLFNFIAFILTSMGYFYWFLTFPFTILFGVLVGIITHVNEQSIKSLPKNLQDSAHEFFVLARNLGLTFGVAVSTVFIVNFIPYYTTFFEPTVKYWFIYLVSYQSMLLIGAASAFAGMIITFKGPRIKKEFQGKKIVIK